MGMMMAKRQQIEFIIRPDGSLEERIIGVEGSDCERITASIEQAIGDILSRERTQDFYSQTHNEDDRNPVTPF
jgi:hypothetical protein